MYEIDGRSGQINLVLKTQNPSLITQYCLGLYGFTNHKSKMLIQMKVSKKMFDFNNDSNVIEVKYEITSGAKVQK